MSAAHEARERVTAAAARMDWMALEIALSEYAVAIRRDEREACAKVAEWAAVMDAPPRGPPAGKGADPDSASNIAEHIRARGKP